MKTRGNTPNNPPATNMHVKTRLSLSINDQIVRKIDRRRGLTKRSTYVEHLIMRGMETGADKEQSRST